MYLSYFQQSTYQLARANAGALVFTREALSVCQLTAFCLSLRFGRGASVRDRLTNDSSGGGPG